MSRRPVKHSLTLKGHRTSVSLEAEFWQAFREIAASKDTAINVLAAEIDADRGTDMGLASAIRLYVLRHYRRPSTGAALSGGQ
ncbi:ribbon-helix-helix domain-containing protein [Roseovarius sp. LXJ103]|uniref:ribbon-helix-helix domain-containing protein n=1 Tax=Roseovarius carneus TaxID=2853164 RepID=UPI000D613D72|nr:ribbon-helix-helix domain-containing protein [Roseovarius carneus]MBZ8119101.1 ribbon-helix-helix domain-containing protein [Roseovarius carneus]PWE35263.1 aryl-sulfate sulfotransferase [Pelagicola sp. LXJ1103]